MEELLQEDGLTILANGLTWQKVFAVLLRLQIERRKDPTQRGVLLVLGLPRLAAHDAQRRACTLGPKSPPQGGLLMSSAFPYPLEPV